MQSEIREETDMPFVDFKYVSGFGDKTEFKTTLGGDGFDSLVYAFRCFALSCGFAYETVNEYFKEE